MVAIHVDESYIYLEAMRNITEAQIIEEYGRIVRMKKLVGIGIKKHILDNEESENFKETNQGRGMSYELVPPGDHRKKIAERAIQTAKNNFILVLCGAHNDFPMHPWCRLLPHLNGK